MNNYAEFVTGMKCAIQKIYPCPDNDPNNKVPLLEMWENAARHYKMSNVVTDSVHDDIGYLISLEKSLSREKQPEGQAVCGIIMNTITSSSETIFGMIVESAKRREKIYSSTNLIGEDMLFLEDTPVEYDVAWILKKYPIFEECYRYIAFPWKGNYKILLIGSHPRMGEYFRESWWLHYHFIKYPQHFIECHPVTGNGEDDFNAFNAFVVDDRENIEGVTEIINLMEELTKLINIMGYTCGIESREKLLEKLRREKVLHGATCGSIKYCDIAKDLILRSISEGLTREILRIQIHEYVDLLCKIQAHKFYQTRMVRSFVDHLVSNDDFYGGLNKLRKDELEGILGISLDNFDEE